MRWYQKSNVNRQGRFADILFSILVNIFFNNICVFSIKYTHTSNMYIYIYLYVSVFVVFTKMAKKIDVLHTMKMKHMTTVVIQLLTYYNLNCLFTVIIRFLLQRTNLVRISIHKYFSFECYFCSRFIVI
jgi:hypothetical protein